MPQASYWIGCFATEQQKGLPMILVNCFTRKRLLQRLSFLIVMAVLILIGSTQRAHAHGTMDDPVCRVYQCYLENPESPDSAACAAAIQLAGTQQFYDWSAVNRFDANDQHRTIIPDGQLCSGGKASHAGLDLAQ
ncbi:MAG: lytic polysaccharide monooxygenase [Caldilineaceae bacterium]